MSASPSRLSSHWTTFVAIGFVALVAVWSFAFLGLGEHNHRPALSVLVGSYFGSLH